LNPKLDEALKKFNDATLSWSDPVAALAMVKKAKSYMVMWERKPSQLYPHNLKNRLNVVFN